MENKSVRIFIRIEEDKKKHWKDLCAKRQVSMTGLIIDSVENRLMYDERRKIIKFIEKQDNIFGKIETNINQITRIANSQKFISEKQLQHFSEKLTDIEKLKKEQNTIFNKIFSLLAKWRIFFLKIKDHLGLFLFLYRCLQAIINQLLIENPEFNLKNGVPDFLFF